MKKENLCIRKCHLSEVCADSRSREKLLPRYIGPFRILERKGKVVYQLELPARLSDVHNIFHMSQLKKCLRVPEEQLPLEELDVQDDLTYIEYLVKILDTLERIT